MARTLIRPGGRSERIQVAVHKAVKELISEIPAENVTIALIAARAEVPPSTIYRRWVTLDQLLLDVANQRFLPDAVPPDTGSFRGDLAVWIEQTVDDLSSAPMRALLGERLVNRKISEVAAGYVYMNFRYLTDRCASRGEPVPSPDRLVDMVFAPLIYRIFFANQVITKSYQAELVETAVSSPLLTQPLCDQPSLGEYAIFENDVQ
ncbi:TetR/AcrR family transcriptional regulator [uncultured Agrobacterium sp.]|uniref:TetR/AcrR family transcriptional regulator n=1 Tax=uncultured Agrobacterium sp. TaxID=157277 RepID=UPI0025CFAE3D|nr:TetR/AcrR family transcriptional regulator [uncultured Agrobacterium sp.]